MADMYSSALTNTLAPISNGGRAAIAVDRLGDLFTADINGLASRAAQAGRLVTASDADFNDAVIGTTTLANTTPAFILRVPTGSAAVPLWFRAHQIGTVAGGAISFIIEVNDTDDYSSGGTAETLYYFRNGAGFTTGCSVYSLPTTANAYGIQLVNTIVGQDVSPAEGAFNGLVWEPKHVLPLIGPACLKVYLDAGTTGPTVGWSIGFADVPPAMFTN